MGERISLIIAAFMLLAREPEAAGLFMLIYAWKLHKAELDTQNVAGAEE